VIALLTKAFSGQPHLASSSANLRITFMLALNTQVVREPAADLVIFLDL